MRLSRALATASLVLLFGLTTAAPADEVVLIPNSTVKATGNRVRGTVTAETPTEVKVDAQSVPVDQIATINYTGEPASLTLAKSREANGALTEALDQYQKAAGEAAGKEFIVRAIQFSRASIMADLAEGDPSKIPQATDALEGFIKANGSSRQLGPALEALAKLQIQKGDFDKAARTLADLSKLAWAADRAGVLQARVLARRGQFDQAIVALDKMLASAPKDSDKYREAQLAKAESLAGLKKFDEAEKTVLAVIKAAPPEDAEAQSLAYNTLGDCLRAAGRPKDALMAYLHTDILFSKDKEQHARALSQIAQLWRELRRDDRAEETLDRLKQDYPNSPWLTAGKK
ncbi:MAG TPA: tetratricopeptide repeat protein [Isosphaeraceae bacterium]|jgi:tetratricopeptide (TPR) repeat protein|nr:tetratricopeptide repeat protein [Isosphaeraceae bacterium]